MRTLTLLVEPGGTRLIAEVPESRRERMVGLLGRDPLPAGRCLLLERARSVHTIGMRTALRVALLGADLRALDVRVIYPRRVVRPRRGVRHVLECPVDTPLHAGDVLRVLEVDPRAARPGDQAGQPPRPAAPVTMNEPPRSRIARFTPSAASAERAEA